MEDERGLNQLPAHVANIALSFLADADVASHALTDARAAALADAAWRARVGYRAWRTAQLHAGLERTRVRSLAAHVLAWKLLLRRWQQQLAHCDRRFEAIVRFACGLDRELVWWCRLLRQHTTAAHTSSIRSRWGYEYGTM